MYILLMIMAILAGAGIALNLTESWKAVGDYIFNGTLYIIITCILCNYSLHYHIHQLTSLVDAKYINNATDTPVIDSAIISFSAAGPVALALSLLFIYISYKYTENQDYSRNLHILIPFFALITFSFLLVIRIIYQGIKEFTLLKRLKTVPMNTASIAKSRFILTCSIILKLILIISCIPLISV